MTTHNNSSWVQPGSQRRDARLRLFCFPYAGGSAALYRGWLVDLVPEIEVLAVELPGRGRRLTEPCLTDVQSVVAAVTTALRREFDRPFALFGHSMGALICFELARYLEANHGVRPEKLIVSARPAPQLTQCRAPVHVLPDEDFVAELRRLNGTPEEVLKQSDLLTMLLPVLRADFQLSETYRYSSTGRLELPITAFGGLNDVDIDRSSLGAWRELTHGKFSLRMFPGSHFFIHSARELVIRMIRRELLPDMHA